MQYIARHLAEFHGIPVSLFLQVVQVPLDGSITSGVSATPLSFVSSAVLLRAYSALQVVNKHIEQSWTQKDPWGTPLITSLCLDFVPLITTLWCRTFNSCSINLTCLPIQSVYSELFYENHVEDSVKGSPGR